MNISKFMEQIIYSSIFSEVSDTISSYFKSMTDAEFYSTILIVVSAAGFIVLERFFPYTKKQKVLREGFFDDLALYTIAQSY
ncbi:MAG: hypothetical protein KJN64_11265, partial [Ignavibacteria bacterium]|nr:hypothetical protein [Ignavibacteria bacterium]